MPSFDTNLSDKENQIYQQYKQTLGNQGTEHDYDLRGYWKKYGQFEQPHELGSHFTD
jgi:hypothetical protein